MGTPLTESKRDISPVYGSLMRIKVLTGGRWRTVGGAVNAGRGENRRGQGHSHGGGLSTRSCCSSTTWDKPGFIGALGTMLGEAEINIATFNLGRQASGQDAIAIVGVDQVVPMRFSTSCVALEHVRYVKVLRF